MKLDTHFVSGVRNVCNLVFALTYSVQDKLDWNGTTESFSFSASTQERDLASIQLY